MVLQHGNRIRKNGGEQLVRELEVVDLGHLADALPPKPSEHEIRRRAYEIYLSRNGAPGSATLDWLQAECELRAGRASSL